MKLDGLKIKCIGFSVTTFGKPNYPQAMQRYFDDRGVKVEVTYASVGGLSIDALPYLLEKILQKNQTDLVILEIATSWFSLVRKNISEAVAYIELIVKYIESMNSSIIFLNMYRKDIEDEDNVVKAISIISENKFHVINFKQYYRNLLNETGDDGTSDGVHPKQDVIDYVSSNICQEIFKILPNCKVNYNELIADGIYQMNAYDILSNNVYEFNNHSGLNLKCRKIYQGEKLIIKNGGKLKISGIFYLMGPDTNQSNIYLDGVLINIPMRDEASYYRRLGYRYLGIYECDEIIIEHPLENLEVNLAREPWEKVECKCNYLLGFSSYI